MKTVIPLAIILFAAVILIIMATVSWTKKSIARQKWIAQEGIEKKLKELEETTRMLTDVVTPQFAEEGLDTLLRQLQAFLEGVSDLALSGEVDQKIAQAIAAIPKRSTPPPLPPFSSGQAANFKAGMRQILVCLRVLDSSVVGTLRVFIQREIDAIEQTVREAKAQPAQTLKEAEARFREAEREYNKLAAVPMPEEPTDEGVRALVDAKMPKAGYREKLKASLEMIDAYPEYRKEYLRKQADSKVKMDACKQAVENAKTALLAVERSTKLSPADSVRLTELRTKLSEFKTLEAAMMEAEKLLSDPKPSGIEEQAMNSRGPVTLPPPRPPTIPPPRPSSVPPPTLPRPSGTMPSISSARDRQN